MPLTQKTIKRGRHLTAVFSVPCLILLFFLHASYRLSFLPFPFHGDSDTGHWLEEARALSRFRIKLQRKLLEGEWSKRGEPRDTVFNATFAQRIADYNDRSKCKTKKTQIKPFRVMQDVMSMADIPNILYFGSVLGYIRDKDMIPTDNDVDIIMPYEAIDLLRPFANEYPVRKKSNHLMISPEGHVAFATDSKRWSCFGNLETKRVDNCATIRALGKLFPPYTGHVDIFGILPTASDVLDVAGKGHMRHHLYPRRACTYMGVETFCPNEPTYIAMSLYGKTYKELAPYAVCLNGKFMWLVKAKDLGYTPKHNYSEEATPYFESPGTLDPCTEWSKPSFIQSQCEIRAIIEIENKRLDKLRLKRATDV